MRAILLAAGLGTRLRPLTLSIPKVLLPVGGKPVIVYNLMLLKKHGIEEVIINLHHLGGVIKEELGSGEKYGLRIRYSEEDEILGTGGGIKKVSRLGPRETLLVLNGDILIDLDIPSLIKYHHEKNGIATMAVRKMGPGEEFTPLLVNSQDRLLSIGERGPDPYMFTGVHLLEPELIDYLPEGRSCIIKNAYQPALGAGERIFGFTHRGTWRDVGVSFEGYQKTEKEFLTNEALRNNFP
ncbi:MAG: nucleotidyltransferase family protein [Deltaproteobacteria bacterium]|nr:nucleotidyltransferase family protein [Deltaproteobacteria bacterium]